MPVGLANEIDMAGGGSKPRQPRADHHVGHECRRPRRVGEEGAAGGTLQVSIAGRARAGAAVVGAGMTRHLRQQAAAFPVAGHPLPVFS